MSFGSTPNGVFGIIIQWDYLHHIFRNFRTLPQYANLSDKALLDALFYNPKFIWLQRQDKIRQAISWIKARHTGEWGLSKEQTTNVQASQPLTYDYFLIDQNVARFVNAENSWQSFFEANQIDPYIVVYETLAKSFEETSRALLAHLDIPYPESINFEDRKWQKQANTLNDKWAGKFVRQKNSSAHRLFRLLRHLRFKLLST